MTPRGTEGLSMDAWQVTHALARECGHWCRAVSVIGSLVTNADRRSAASDIDLIVLVDALDGVLDYIPGLDATAARVVKALLASGSFDAISTKFDRHGVTLSMSVYAVHHFDALMRLTHAHVAYYRTRSNAGHVALRSFDGSVTRIALAPETLASGYVVEEPCWPTERGRSLCGVLPDALLSCVRTLVDDGAFARALDRLWDNVVRCAIEHVGHGSPSAESVAAAVTRCLVHEDDLGEDARRAIRQNCAEALTRLRMI